MPTTDCKCGVQFYSLDAGECLRCRFGEFVEESDNMSRGSYPSLAGPGEYLIQSVLSSLDREVSQEKLIEIVHFVCKFLEAKHIMPPFYFGTAWTGREFEIIAALTNLEREGIVTIRRQLSDGRFFIEAKHLHVGRSDDVDRDMGQLIRVLGNHSAPEIRDLLRLHFPGATPGDEIGHTGNDISRLFPSFDDERMF